MTWRAATADDRNVAWLWAVVASMLVALRGFWEALVPFVPACPWHLLTGFACPGCGTTRAAMRLLHLDVPGAFAMNPLAALAIALFLLCGVAAPFWIAFARRVPVVRPGPKPGWAITAVAAVGLNWAWLVARGV